MKEKITKLCEDTVKKNRAGRALPRISVRLPNHLLQLNSTIQ